MPMPLPLHALHRSEGLGRPLEDMFWVNTNFKRSGRETAPQYSPDATMRIYKSLPIGFLGGVRETPEGSPAGAKPTYNWAGKPLRWLLNMRAEPWMLGRKLLLNPMLEGCLEGTPPYGAAWEDNIRWKLGQIANAFPENSIAGWLFANEPDNTDMTYLDFARDAPADEVNTVLERQTRMARVTWEELRTGPRLYVNAPHPGFIAGPTMGYPLNQGGDKYTLRQVLTHNNGEIISYWDVISVHNHNFHSNIESFDGTPPNDAAPTMYHAWKSLEEARALNPSAPLQPLCNDEAGIGYLVRTGSYDDPHSLKAWRLTTAVFAMHWYGVCLWSQYCLMLSGDTAGMNFLDDSSPDFPAFPEWGEFLDIMDYRRFSIDLYTPVLPAKSWRDFHRTYSWAVVVKSMVTPSVTTGNPFPEWSRVTFPGGQVDMAAGDRNLVFRPIYLRSLRPHRLTVEVKVNGGGAVKLRARGFDKLNGLAEVSAATSNSQWTSLSVMFTPRQHTVQNFPNPAYVLFVVDHNGVGTASFRNPQITPL